MALSNIEWTDYTFNPWRGCTKVSPGCKNCYMFRDMHRYGLDPSVVTRTKTWNDPIKWQREAEKQNKRFLVFTCSWSDFFHVDADQWRADAWALIKKCDRLIFQVLTKRAGRISANLPADWNGGYPNVWLGVSVENQQAADERIPFLIKATARCRFISAEPLLGSVNLCKYLDRLDWIIAGGESGPQVDPTHPGWVRSLRLQCKETGTPFFFKQWGEWAPIDKPWEQNSPKRLADNETWWNLAGGSGFHGDEVYRMRRVGKKQAGRLLDNRTHDELPILQ